MGAATLSNRLGEETGMASIPQIHLLLGLHQHCKKHKQKRGMADVCTGPSSSRYIISYHTDTPPGCWGDLGEGISLGMKGNCCHHSGMFFLSMWTQKQFNCFLLLCHNTFYLASTLWPPMTALQTETKSCSQRYKEPTVTLISCIYTAQLQCSHSHGAQQMLLQEP